MARYKIAWLPGDGVGNDVMQAAKIILDETKLDAEYIHGDIGWEFWRKEGNPLPDRTKKLLNETTCALFGAITSKPKEEADKELAPELKGKGLVYKSPIVSLRQEFNLHTCLRPCKAYPGNPLNFELRSDIDWAIFRENTEGMYGGVEFHPLPKEVFDTIAKHNKAICKFEKFGLENIAMSTRIMSRQMCANIVKQAFEFARKFKRKSVTVVDKPNVLRETGGLMIRTAREVAKNYPEIKMYETNIDAQTMWMLKNPLDYDVIVAENMFGDILSDLAAQMVGGMGFASSANIGDKYAVFEPSHGSAPKYAGLYKVNPIAMILTVKLMLDWLGETEKGAKLEKAVAAVIAESNIRTYDMIKGAKDSKIVKEATTLEMAQEIARKYREQ